MKLTKLLLKITLAAFISIAVLTHVKAQNIDILLKGGHVIDPKNKIDQIMDVAISNGKITQVASNISASVAKRVVDAKGMYVTPGIIDIHVHTFPGNNLAQGVMDGPSSVYPDGFTFRSGVTTVADAGTPGWKTFPLYKKNIIDRSVTRVLVFLNIVGDGMGEFQQDVTDMSPKLAAATAMNYKDYIVGFKVAHFDSSQWIPVDSAVAAGKLANLPVMIDFRGLPPNDSIEELFTSHLRPGDIFTHTYHRGRGRDGSTRVEMYKEAIVDNNSKVKPFVFKAQQRGIIFDVGHGANGFVFNQAVPAMAQGFWPNSISSDLHTGGMNAGMKDMANIMSKFLNMGMPLQDVILRSTWNPAQIMKRPALGNLSVGMEADVAVFSVLNGDFGFIDAHGGKLKGNKKLQAELTIRAGKVEWDLNGISEDLWNAK